MNLYDELIKKGIIGNSEIIHWQGRSEINHQRIAMLIIILVITTFIIAGFVNLYIFIIGVYFIFKFTKDGMTNFFKDLLAKHAEHRYLLTSNRLIDYNNKKKIVLKDIATKDIISYSIVETKNNDNWSTIDLIVDHHGKQIVQTLHKVVDYKKFLNSLAKVTKTNSQTYDEHQAIHEPDQDNAYNDYRTDEFKTDQFETDEFKTDFEDKPARDPYDYSDKFDYDFMNNNSSRYNYKNQSNDKETD